MFLYALGLEPLIFKINSNPNIQGIKLPNSSKESKSLQHADDTIVIIKNKKKTYTALNTETKKYSENSGSKINQDKTEILTLGNCNDLKHSISKTLFKDKIKVYGIKFGENEIQENLDPKIQKLKQAANKWNKPYFDIFEKKTIIVKTYLLSLLQYTMMLIEIKPDYLKQINTIIFNFIWNGKPNPALG